MWSKTEIVQQVLWEDANLSEAMNLEEFTAKLLSVYADLLEKFYSNIYYLLRSYRVKYVKEHQVKIVAAFLAYKIVGIKVCTERMIRYLCKEVMGEEKGAVMSTLHKLGDFKVITIIRTPATTKQTERYRFLLTEPFIQHIGEFWKEE